MKIGVITIEQVNNYGAELQATATIKVLHGMGYEAEIIDYCYYKNWNFKDTRFSAPFVPMRAKGRLMYWVKYRLVNRIVAKVLPMLYSTVRRRIRRFEDFHKINTRMSKRYLSMPELYQTKMDYDVYVVGSDQVWNPSASSSIEPYFLTFAPKEAKKISYASSFGVSNIPASLYDKYKKLLSNIDSLSVREQTGVCLVKALTGRDATCVLDPTLLLNKEQWGNIMLAYPHMPSRYILVYQLLPSETLPSLAKKLSEEMDCSVYYLAKRAYAVNAPKGMKVIKDAGPAEFLWLIKNASCVVTNSFHGTAFSVNFGTLFYAVLKPDRGGNARITSLLNSVNLMNRIVYEGDVMPAFSAFDTDLVQKEIEVLRNDSISFLKNALEK